MDFWLIFFIFTTLIGFGAAGFLLHLLRKMDFERTRMEDFLIELSQVIADFKLKIDSLFKVSIHYYDETIYDFVESTKNVKLEIDKVLNEYDDLKEFIIPEAPPEEPTEVDVLGVVKGAIPNPLSRK
jgi:hypothetical protein